MRLIEELGEEHRLIERVVGSLRTFVAARVAGSAPREDGPRFLRFFQLWAGQYHHGREEQSLFEALRRIELPGERGPIAVLLADHHRFTALLGELEECLGAQTFDPAATTRIEDVARTYAHALWHHIDAEDSVLFPEGEARLTKGGTAELTSRAPTPEEREARDDGVALVDRYPPTSDDDALRGDACVACPFYGVSCEGLEHEWWSESEWDEIHDHLPTG